MSHGHDPLLLPACHLIIPLFFSLHVTSSSHSSSPRMSTLHPTLLSTHVTPSSHSSSPRMSPLHPTLLLPTCLCSKQQHCHNYSLTLTAVCIKPNSPQLSTHFKAHPTPYAPHSFSVPHNSQIFHSTSDMTRLFKRPLPLTVHHKLLY